MTRSLLLKSLIGLLAVSIGACHLPRTPQSRVASAATDDNPSIMTILFLGLSSADGVGVSEQQWESFLHQMVGPSFPDGFTVLPAHGQYLSERDKQIVQEHTRVLLLVHPNSQISRDAIVEIVGEYKRRFNQESVLRIEAPVQARF